MHESEARPRRKTVAIGGWLAGAAITLAACGFEPPKTPTITASITGLNHTDTYVATFYVNGAYGGNISRRGGGGKTTCCVELPRTYRPGLAATIRWSATNTREDLWQEKTVPVDTYGPEGGSLFVHFLPDDEVRLVVSNLHPQHPDYPGPGMPSGYKVPRQEKQRTMESIIEDVAKERRARQ